MIAALKKKIQLNAKHLGGWRTDCKIVVFSVDDYGNVRLDSKEAREKMNAAGLKVKNRFDAFDTLETREDMEMLFEVLESVKDRAGRPAVFTPFSVPCNIDFEKVADNGYSSYEYEYLTDTFRKKENNDPEAYRGAWECWKEGIQRGIFLPQFHGREHLNLKVFEEKLAGNDHSVLTALKNRSYTSISGSGCDSVSTLAAFDFDKFEETARFDELIHDGLNAFEEVFGYRAEHFMAPAGREHPVTHKALYENGIRYIDTPLIKREHQGNGNYKKVFNYTGKTNRLGQTFLVRNVVFEPVEKRGLNWVDFAEKQIEAAFRWKKPAIISSHRVNFCGHIDPGNRKKGLEALKSLLNRIITRWPDVEFMAANELGKLVEKEKGA